MQVNFEYDGVAASSRLEQLVKKRLDNMEDKYDFIVRFDVFFQNERTSSREAGKICKIKLRVPGSLLFSEASHKKFEMSIQEAADDLERQLQKKKGKLKAN